MMTPIKLSLVIALALATQLPLHALSPQTKRDIAQGQALLEEDPKAAEKSFRRALRREKHPTAVKGLGWALWKQGLTDQAIVIWEDLVAREPENTVLRNQLGKLYTQAKRLSDARKAYEQTLAMAPQDREALTSLAHIAEWEHNPREALERFASLEATATQAEMETLKYKLGKAYFDVREYSAAEAKLAEVLKLSPNHALAESFYARSLYHQGKYDQALPLLEAIREKDASNVFVRDVLALYYQSKGDSGRVESLLEELVKISPSMRFQNQLGAHYMNTKAYTQAIEAYQASLALDPHQTEPRISIAEAYLLSGQLDQAQKHFSELLSEHHGRMGPRVAQDLTDIFYLSGHREEASTNLRKILESYPHNLRFQLRLARLEADLGRYDSARHILDGIDHPDHDRAIPVLLYHRINPHPGEGVVTQADFEDQLMMLKKEGFETISVSDLNAYYERRQSLPPKPILLTFDDAIKDVLLYADPVLKKVGFKASMFVPTGVIEEAKPFFMTWDELRGLQASGRWELQCHSHRGHQDIVIHASGSKGRFLVNRQWLANEGRLESEEEFEKRVRQDYPLCKETLEDRVPGTRVMAYSYPYGDFGTESASNSSLDIASINLSEVQKHFSVSFIQNRPGFNILKTPAHLSMRINVPNDWRGKELKAHLVSENPIAQAKGLRAAILLEEGKAQESLSYLKRSELAALDPQRYHERASFAYEGIGNPIEALKSWQVVGGASESYTQRLSRLEGAVAPELSSRVTYFSDSNERRVLTPSLAGKLHVADHIFASAEYDHTFSVERRSGVPLANQEADSDGVRLGTHYLWDKDTEVSVLGGARRFSTGEINPEILARVRFPLLAQRLTLSAHTEYAPLVFANATYLGITQWQTGAALQWQADPFTRLRVLSQALFLSDDNRVLQGQAYLRRDLWKPLGLHVAATLDYRDSESLTFNYYAPQAALQATADVGIGGPILSNLRGQLLLSSGYGRDDLAGSIWIAQARGRLDWTLFKRLLIYSDVGFSRSPSYDSMGLILGLTQRF